MARSDYKVLFYEKDNFLYYIGSDKKISKMKEVVRCFMIHRMEVPLTAADLKLLKQFDLNKVYEQKIVSFANSRGVKPERAKEG